jgi:DMSO/TMAO reductase YedYZ molybdopterin-dependent catalytic subunit
VVLGIVTAIVALAVAQVVAALISSEAGAPVNAVGELSIDHAPPSVKNFAIQHFGSHDKTVLVWGIRGVLIIFAAVIGMMAVRRLWLGMAGLAVFIAVGILAAESQPTSTVGDAFPTVVGGLAAALFLWKMTGLARAAAGLPRSWQAEPAAPPAQALPPAQAQPPPAQAVPPGQPDRPGPDAHPDPGPDGQPEPDADLGPDGRDREQAGPAPLEPWQSWQPADRPAGPSARPPAMPPVSPSRRKFLYVSAGAAGAGLLAYGGGTLLGENRDVAAAEKSLRLPPAATPAPSLPSGYDLKIPGLSSFITPNSSFYRVDTAIVLPEVLPSSWQLRIHGMVRKEIVLTFDDLIKRPLIEDYITLCCVSNPVGGPYIGNAKWLGASLRSILQEAGVQPGAEQLLCTSADGFTSGTPVQTAMDGRDALLAVAMNDAPLPVAHGFPARLVIPGLYGYVSACKWITDIEVTTYAANVSFWAQRGWSAQAPIKTESRIDVPSLGGTVKAGTQTAIAGVAWAQHKGIEAVEVRIDKGPWQEAKLASVPDIDTWRQWAYYWDVNVPKGNYVIEARATDKTGYTQTAVQAQPEPNGASGYPTVEVYVS